MASAWLLSRNHEVTLFEADNYNSDEREQSILGGMPYQANDTVLHTDASLLPIRRKAWAAWNAWLPRDPGEACTVSYCMNLLQGIDSPEPFVVTLNRTTAIDPSKVLARDRNHDLAGQRDRRIDCRRAARPLPGRSSKSRARACRDGLWRYSRHPNYFFEWLHWFAYVCLAWDSPVAWLAWAGPAVMYVFLRWISGIPYTEAHALHSRGDDYRTYQRSTSMLIPWFPKRIES